MTETLGWPPPRQLGDPCENCNERPSSVRWVGEGGVIAFSRGWYRAWCELCAVEARLAYAREQAAAIPELERRVSLLARLADHAIDTITDETPVVRGTLDKSLW